MAKADAAPWIGLPVQMDPGSDKQYLDRRYSDAVAAAGGVPILISLVAISYLNPLRWVLGIQWHPERNLDCDDFSRKLFEHFTARCRAVRGMDEGTRT